MTVRAQALLSQETPVNAGAAAGEVILCPGRTMDAADFLRLVPFRKVTVEPDLSQALRRSLEGDVSILMVDLAATGPAALSALTHLRLLRPEQRIVLLKGEDDPTSLDQTLLENLPVVSFRRRPEEIGPAGTAR